jgi:hydroxymethylbilane synthase
MVADRLRRLGAEVEIVILKTRGDQDRVRAFAELGSHGVFVRELEIALLEERIDLAVHSYKDLPSTGPATLGIAAVPERVDVADLLLLQDEPAAELAEGPLPLREGVRVGTASARRRSQLLEARPDLRVELLRGNVPTRLRRLRDGDFDAVLLAAAGVHRLLRALPADSEFSVLYRGLAVRRLEPSRFVPAPTQGAVACQTRHPDAAVEELVGKLDDGSLRTALAVERELLARVEGGCEVPFGAWCREAEDGLYEVDAYLDREGRVTRAHARGRKAEPLIEAAWEGLRGGAGGRR